MDAKPYYNSFYLQIYPRGAGDYGFASISGIEYDQEQAESLFEEMKDQIKRHVDSVRSVHMEFDTYLCGKCESDFDTRAEAEQCCTTQEN